MIAAADEPPPVGDQFEATVVWMADEPMLRGRNYLMRVGTADRHARRSRRSSTRSTSTRSSTSPRTTLELNEIGVVDLELVEADRVRPVRREPRHRRLHPDRPDDEQHGRRRHAPLRAPPLGRTCRGRRSTSTAARGPRSKGQRPFVVWLTGIPGAGKSTIANLVEKQLHAAGFHTTLLDGDNLRHGLTKDLGFTDADRVENVRRAGEVARLMVDAGLIVIASFVSPFANERETARATVGEGEFVEVFVDTPLELAEERDPKGLYAKARRGELPNLTGVDSPYERPEAPDVHLEMAQLTWKQAAERVVEALRDRGLLERSMTWQFVLAGLLVGALVGMTGMGGGSLMTPLLILVFNFDPQGRGRHRHPPQRRLQVVRRRAAPAARQRPRAAGRAGCCSGRCRCRWSASRSRAASGRPRRTDDEGVGAALFAGALGLGAEDGRPREAAPSDAPFLLSRRAPRDRGRARRRRRLRRRADLRRQRHLLRPDDAARLPADGAEDRRHGRRARRGAALGGRPQPPRRTATSTCGAMGWLLVGSVPGVILGSRLSIRVPERGLRLGFSVVLVLVRDRSSSACPPRTGSCIGGARRRRRGAARVAAPAHDAPGPCVRTGRRR